MALLKEVVYENGVTTNYHRIGYVSLQDSTLSCCVDSYVSKDYREKERNADSLNFRFEITVEEEESMGIRQLTYKKIKELPEWADAVDC